MGKKNDKMPSKKTDIVIPKKKNKEASIEGSSRITEGGNSMKNLNLDGFSTKKIATLALITCKKLINKQAQANSVLTKENNELNKNASQFVYEERLRKVASKLVEAGVVPESDVYQTVEELRGKYASYDQIPDPDFVFNEYTKLASAWGTIDENDRNNYSSDPEDQLADRLENIINS